MDLSPFGYAGQTGVTYSIAQVPSATSYAWTVAPDASITAGQGTTSITVTFGNAGGNVDIDVTASNNCGTSAPSTMAVTVTSTLLNNLVSYWKLDESSNGSGAVTRADSHGANNLSDNNTTASGAGKIGNGADFELSNSEYLSISDGLQTGLDITGDLSVSVWFKPESQPPSGDDYPFIWKVGSGSGGYGFNYRDTSGVKKFHNLLYDNDAPSTNVNYDKNVSELTNGTWYHVAFTFKVSSGIMTFYVNGSNLGTAIDTSVNPINNSTGAFQVGADNEGPNRRMDGVLDEMAIWNRELTAAEVTQLYNSGSGLAYPF